jgi:hypothetical protein
MTTTLATIESKAEELNQEIIPELAIAGEIVVKDAMTYQMAGETWKSLTALEKKIKAYWEDDVTTALKLHRSLVAKRDAMLIPVGEQKNSLRLGMKTFEDEQERIRRAEQARLEEEARKAAEEAALAQAVALEMNGHKAAAEAVIAVPVVAPAVYVPKTTPTGFGNATRRVWGAEVTDLMALVKAVAAGTVPIQAIEANSVFLNQQARALKSALQYPGVRAVEK